MTKSGVVAKFKFILRIKEIRNEEMQNWGIKDFWDLENKELSIASRNYGFLNHGIEELRKGLV